jgi:putative inorganic carbon (HCO3(-)) transporter
MTRDRMVLPWAAAGAAGLLAVSAAVAAGRAGDPMLAYLLVAGVLALPAGLAVAGAVSPAVTICAGLALSVFSGNFGRLGVPIGIDRVLVVTGIAAVLVRELRSEQPRVRVTWLHVCLALVLAYAGLNAVFAGTLGGNEPFFGLLDYLGVIPFALFLVAPAAFPGPAERRLLLGTLVGVGLYLGVTALLETAGPSSLIVPAYIADPSVGIHYGRARGPFVEAAGNGLALYMCGVACAVALAQWRRHRWLPALGLLLCAMGIEFTLTRQVWLGAAAATSVAVLAHPVLRRWIVPLAVLGATVVAAGLAVVPGFSDKADTRFASKRPVWDRLNSDDAALRMIADRPLAGFGWYRFGDASRDYYRLAADRALTTVGRAHNVFLGYAAELGVLAVLAWVACLLAALVGALRRRGPPDLDVWRAGLVAVAVAWLIVANFTPMGYAFVHSVLWLWAGLCWSRT